MARIVLAITLIASVAACATSRKQAAEANDTGSAANPIVASAKAPKMDPRRKVAEEDCSKPLTDQVDNIRCR